MFRPLVVTSLLLTGAGSLGPDRAACPASPTPSSRALIQTTCDLLRSALRRVPGASVRSGRTAFLDERFDCSRQGCVVSLKGSFKKLKDQASPDVWLDDFLEQRGWSRTSSHDADGPDGTVYALHQPGALCIVEGRWSHYDDADGDHTDDWYRITVSCGGAGAEPPRQPGF
jgi:hypothetical protein